MNFFYIERQNSRKKSREVLKGFGVYYCLIEFGYAFSAPICCGCSNAALPPDSVCEEVVGNHSKQPVLLLMSLPLTHQEFSGDVVVTLPLLQVSQEEHPSSWSTPICCYSLTLFFHTNFMSSLPMFLVTFLAMKPRGLPFLLLFRLP